MRAKGHIPNIPLLEEKNIQPQDFILRKMPWINKEDQVNNMARAVSESAESLTADQLLAVLWVNEKLWATPAAFTRNR